MSRKMIALAALLGVCTLGGCASTKVIGLDAAHPSIRASSNGFLIGNRFVVPQEIIDTLEDYEVPKDRVIHILIDEDMESNLKPVRAFMGMLAKAGYRRSVLVTKKHAESEVVTEAEQRERTVRRSTSTPSRKKIRYKGANE